MFKRIKYILITLLCIFYLGTLSCVASFVLYDDYQENYLLSKAYPEAAISCHNYCEEVCYYINPYIQCVSILHPRNEFTLFCECVDNYTLRTMNWRVVGKQGTIYK